MVDKLTECGKQGPKALQEVHYDIAFDVFVTEGGHVENVLLKESTLHLDEVEGCMAQALYGLSTSDETVSLRRRKLPPGTPLAPEQRALLGQGLEVLALAAAFGVGLIVVGMAYYDVKAYYFVIQNHSKPRPHHHPPQTEEPPAPSSAPAPEPPPQDAPKPEGPMPPVPPPVPPPPPPRDSKCPQIAEKITYWIYNVRPPTPAGGFPQGYQGLAERWREYATNKGGWGLKADGNLGDKPRNHLEEYRKYQGKLKEELNRWAANHCEEKGYSLPRLAEEYAKQQPELGPGKPLAPKAP